MKLIARWILPIASVLAASFEATAENHIATVAYLQGYSASFDCFYFTLNGVSVADPNVSSGGPWIAFPRGTDAAKDVYATLLAAKATGASVSISTTGTPICGGYTGINQVLLTP